MEGDNTIYSSVIDDEVFIGFKSIILEGAKLERGCKIGNLFTKNKISFLGPNSIVPPGRLIPAG